jgi:hypothetical protein
MDAGSVGIVVEVELILRRLSAVVLILSVVEISSIPVPGAFLIESSRGTQGWFCLRIRANRVQEINEGLDGEAQSLSRVFSQPHLQPRSVHAAISN